MKIPAKLVTAFIFLASGLLLLTALSPRFHAQAPESFEELLTPCGLTAPAAWETMTPIATPTPAPAPQADKALVGRWQLTHVDGLGQGSVPEMTEMLKKIRLQFTERELLFEMDGYPQYADMRTPYTVVSADAHRVVLQASQPQGSMQLNPSLNHAETFTLDVFGDVLTIKLPGDSGSMTLHRLK